MALVKVEPCVKNPHPRVELEIWWFFSTVLRLNPHMYNIHIIYKYICICVFIYLFIYLVIYIYSHPKKIGWVQIISNPSSSVPRLFGRGTVQATICATRKFMLLGPFFHLDVNDATMQQRRRENNGGIPVLSQQTNGFFNQQTWWFFSKSPRWAMVG
jgi:hypothetical protein